MHGPPIAHVYESPQTNELAKTTNMTGRNSKFAFQNTALLECVVGEFYAIMHFITLGFPTRVPRDGLDLQ